MTFFEHLRELRDRLVRVVLYVVAGFFVAWQFHDPIFNFVAAPIRDGLAQHGVYTFRSIEIAETMFVYMKLSLVGGLFLTLPLTLRELWRFIAPGLYERERQAIYPVVFFSTLFFVLGAWFAYEVVVPFLASYLAEITLDTGGVEMDVTVKSAFDFALLLLVGFGISFELPMLMFFVSSIGLVTAKQYVKAFRYFIVVSFIVAGILTPPDPISQTMMAVPLNLLYWVGVAGAYAVERRRTDDDGKPLMAFQARIWGLLGLSLLAVAVSLYGMTYWLGRSTSPFRLVPKDALSVTSVRLGLVSDSALPAGVANKLLAAAGCPLPDDGPTLSTEHVVAIRLASSECVVVVAEGCRDGGVCAGDDLLLGPAAAVEAIGDVSESLEEDTTLVALNSSGPAFHWDRAPNAGWFALVPGDTPMPVPALEAAALVADLRSTAPAVQATFWLKAAEDVTGVVSRADLWRHDRNRAAADAAAQTDLSRSLVDLSQLLADAIQASAVPQQTRQDLERRAAAITARLGGHKAPTTAAVDTSLVTRLGRAVASWTLGGAERAARFNLTLVPGEGAVVIEAALAHPQ